MVTDHARKIQVQGLCKIVVLQLFSNLHAGDHALQARRKAPQLPTGAMASVPHSQTMQLCSLTT